MSKARDVMLARGMVIPPWPPDEIGDRLALGDQLRGSRAVARAGMRFQIEAAVALLRAKGFPLEMLAPLTTLERALEALDRGIADPVLRPSSPPRSRPQDPPRLWETKAILVLALETRMAWGEPLRDAAAALGRNFPMFLLPGNVIEWRKQFDTRGKNAAPRDGGHWTILATGRRLLAERRSNPCAADEPGGRGSYEALLRQAADKLHDR